jgi:hypothetical protein
MGALTDTGEDRTLNWLTGNVPATAPVFPLKVALFTVAGSDSVVGTEVVGGSYVRQAATFTVSSGGQASNTGTLRFTNMPDIPIPGVVAFAVYDSAAVPVRWWWALLTTARTYVAGDAAEFPVGELVLALD